MRHSFQEGTWNFNPLHREGGDDDDLIVLQDILIFQSTPPRGWRLTHNGLAHLLITISIHSTARVETYRKVVWQCNHKISIHSTARVETAELLELTCQAEISIHSTARVETISYPNFSLLITISIHSTARVETAEGYQPGEAAGISIHSTARVETTGSWKLSGPSPHFNPLHREGGDTAILYSFLRFSRFQSTPPRGWRRYYCEN